MVLSSAGGGQDEAPVLLVVAAHQPPFHPPADARGPDAPVAEVHRPPPAEYPAAAAVEPQDQ